MVKINRTPVDLTIPQLLLVVFSAILICLAYRGAPRVVVATELFFDAGRGTPVQLIEMPSEQN